MPRGPYYVYIITNWLNAVLYIGVTNNIHRRMHEHKHGEKESFSRRYRLTKLVYLEEFQDVRQAIRREKQLKNWHRAWKLDLIRENNPDFRDLAGGGLAF